MKKHVILLAAMFLATACEKSKFSGSGGGTPPVTTGTTIPAPGEIDVAGKKTPDVVSPPAPAPVPGNPPVEPVPGNPPVVVVPGPGPAPVVPPGPVPGPSNPPIVPGPIPVPPQPAPVPSNAVVNANISCSNETNGSTLTYGLPTPNVTAGFFIQRVCNSTTTKNDIDGKPIDVIFVIDVTGSITTQLGTIKDNIVTFSNAITNMGGNARFAAIGFRDEDMDIPEVRPRNIDDIVGFTDAQSFQNAVSNWQARDGNDWPEQGQLGIWNAVNLFKSDMASNPSRKNAVKAIFYVSDAIAYLKRELPFNFELNKLITHINDAKSNGGLSKLKFFYSASPDRHFSNNNDPRFIPPNEQMENLRVGANLSGMGFAYPLTKNAFLVDFLREVNKQTVTVNTDCFPQYMNVKRNGTVIAGGQFGTLQATYNDRSTSDSSVQVGKSVTASRETLQVSTQRCCVLSGDVNATSCYSTINKTMNVKFGD